MISPTQLDAMVIHLPIALLIAGFLFELISRLYKKEFFQHAGFFLLILGTLFTITSYILGDAALSNIEGATSNTSMVLHEKATTISLWLAVITTAIYAAIFYLEYNMRWLKTIALLFFAGVVTSIVRADYLEGQMQYKHWAGMERSIQHFPYMDKEIT